MIWRMVAQADGLGRTLTPPELRILLPATMFPASEGTFRELSSAYRIAQYSATFVRALSVCLLRSDFWDRAQETCDSW
jgi:hypothetical protein